MPRQTRRQRRNRTARPQYGRRQMRASAPVFVPSWLKSASRVVSNGINSLLREINTKRRRSLGETRRSR